MTGARPFLFVESNTSGTGRLFALAARALELTPVLVTARPEAYAYLGRPGAPELWRVRAIDEDALHFAIRARYGDAVAGVTSSSEYWVATAAALAARLGLPGPDAAAVRAARDKSWQRRALAAGGVPVPAFRAVASACEAGAAAREIGGPVVVKPVDGSGSVGVRACAGPAEAEAHAAALLAAGGGRRLLVEERIDGDEFSVEVFSGRAIGITRKHLGRPPCFVEAGHDYPAVLPPETAAALVRAALRGTELLGLGWGPLHWELRVRGGVAYPMEVNPRLAGGFIPELVRQAQGIDLVRQTVRLAAGLAPELEPAHRRHASIRFLFPPAAGRLASVEGEAAARSLELVTDVDLYRAPGDALPVEHDFRDRAGHVIACADAARDACAAAERARAAIRLNVEAEEEGGDADAAIHDELPFYQQVDRAHLVVLAEAGLLPRERARRLLRAIAALEAGGHAPLRGRPAPRGPYPPYEGWLIDTLGDEVGGAVHLARSHDDLNATVLRLRLRARYARLVREGLRLCAALLRGARRHAAVTMPVCTHAQAALPVTYGHYLAGVAAAVLRDLRGIEAAAAELARCPLGAGGTTLPIDPGRAAALLGFRGGVPHPIDAVASRDLVLRLLGAASVLGVTLSRLATDLQRWSTAELGLVAFPDERVGSSSMLPQKRNAFLLEHIQGRAGAPLGAFTAAAVAMHATPFGNSVAAGTEGVKPVWGALDQVAEATLLARLLVAGVEPRPEAMRRRAEEGCTAATGLANRQVVEAGLPFRRAHHRVGEAVTAAAEAAEPSLRRILGRLRAEWAASARRLRARRRGWSDGARALEHAVAAIVAADAPPSAVFAGTAVLPGTVVGGVLAEVGG